MSGTPPRHPDDPGTRQLPLAGEPLPLELINTTYIKGGVRGRLIDALDTPVGPDSGLARWLADHREEFSAVLRPALDGAVPSPAHTSRFLELRGALRDLAAARASGGTPGPGDIAVVNAAARLASPWQELAPGPGFTAVPRWPGTDPLLTALGEIALAAVGLFTGDRADLVRACPAPGCVLYFVKAHPRREWCTPGCGNRVRVARHSRREKAARPQLPVPHP
ncbi:CGNR zinc finger domain-containing protein [Streptomyces sp. NPDC001985]|uniref:CGNR zinc finger domain-containing protein n=1 Tax=Streptomyces sp. NPDC001985 TaxID=3154406 RepID=UPI003317A59C